jgi:hypothetical protein
MEETLLDSQCTSARPSLGSHHRINTSQVPTRAAQNGSMFLCICPEEAVLSETTPVLLGCGVWGKSIHMDTLESCVGDK